VIDIYHANEVTDFKAIRACGILAVMHKATEGGDR
jgi:GH25 family lysozyme M1 (1,4-beta-N-acetylmuramidase)